MIKVAKSKCGHYKNQSVFIIQDFGKGDWIQAMAGNIPVDVVISGFSIHHQENKQKKRLFEEIFDQILKPGGVFFRSRPGGIPGRGN